VESDTVFFNNHSVISFSPSIDLRRSDMFRLIFLVLLLATPSFAADIYPPLVEGAYTFSGLPADAGRELAPDETPAASLGAVRVDSNTTDIGVLDCQVIGEDRSVPVSFRVTLQDMSQNAEIRLLAFATDDCTGLSSEPSEDAGRIFLVPPQPPTLLP
jgi:hypothetical protein